MFVTVQPGQRCPCGSGQRFDACCGPIIAGSPATTARELMRSRYTAFVIGDVDHLRATWHPGTAPSSLELDPAQRWTGLQIVDTSGGGAQDKRGIVEFRASWRAGADSGVLHERSRFVRQSGRWWYLDGVVSGNSV